MQRFGGRLDLLDGLIMDHIGVVVPNIDAAMTFYSTVLNCLTTEKKELADHDIAVSFVTFSNLRIELISPLGLDRPPRALLAHHTSSDFLERCPQGGLHHFCYLTTDLKRSLSDLQAAGVRALGTGEPAIGATGRPIIFLDPDTTGGSLIELKELE